MTTTALHGLSFQKSKKNLEGSYIDLWKYDLNKEKDSEWLVLFKTVSHRANNDILKVLWKEMHFYFIELVVLSLIALSNWYLIKKQKCCIRCTHWVTYYRLYGLYCLYEWLQIYQWLTFEIYSFKFNRKPDVIKISCKIQTSNKFFKLRSIIVSK